MGGSRWDWFCNGSPGSSLNLPSDRFDNVIFTSTSQRGAKDTLPLGAGEVLPFLQENDEERLAERSSETGALIRRFKWAAVTLQSAERRMEICFTSRDFVVKLIGQCQKACRLTACVERNKQMSPRGDVTGQDIKHLYVTNGFRHGVYLPARPFEE
ncbi:hypothetical protein Bbelb_324240 [Branchiostoma belcheri]|nr:hypothetical protein Bbelb_338560 [Branchiostoma belcheri]KAI8489794.1 hypothetical protein Bbelb_324240 [Branchiostoma belcheri]